MPLQHFHPTVARWFTERIGAPSPPQVEGWPKIRSGENTLIAAPTGSGKTLAAFLWAIDGLLRQGGDLPDQTQVLYVSPLKALGNDVQKNLQRPLAELSGLMPDFPTVRVLVRTGDTRPSERASMGRKPPHILVTTPESLYILLTSGGGRTILRTVRTVIVDEIHAVAGNKRGAHLALSLERLEALVGRPLQRIGLSATQKPISEIADLLVGVGRECALVDIGHRRDLDVAIELPDSPLATVCSHETWEEIVRRMAELIRGHRTTLVFVNTRKLAERIAARLTSMLGEGQVTSHHGSLARERRLDAERRLKEGALRALVATASLELGIDIGDVDLVIQIGATYSISVLLQRVGRSGHALAGVPKGRIFPLTQDELVTATALLESVRRGDLDRTPSPGRALDILAQQIVAACVPETWEEARLYDVLRRAWPYRALARDEFDDVVRLHTVGRGALLHRDGVHGRLRATRRASITALTSGGAIADTGQYRVVIEPEGTLVGSLDEDFAVEANGGDIFQLGNASWRILRVEPGVVRVADAQGAPPTIPFWLGEAPSRTRELSEAVGRVRVGGRSTEWLEREVGVSRPAAVELAEYLNDGERALGAVPTPTCVVLERFFDESGGMQLVIHAPFGGRINRAWGLALRKRFCRGFGFELQAAANDEAIVLSLGPQHSFPLEEVFQYLHPDVAKDLLVQALLDAPMFGTRWRWNLARALLVPRTQNGGKRVPTPLLRMRAEDELVKAFPQALACGETLPPGDLPVPWEHPMVRQTIEDCLTEAMDVDGFLDVLHRIRDGRIRRVAVDTREPSVFARGILNVMPYGFLDDAPLEERRTQAVTARRRLDPETADTLGALDPESVARVREQAWPQPENAEEVHESLLWMGYVTHAEAAASDWVTWLEELRDAGRVLAVPGSDGEMRWRAVEAPQDAKSILRGRLEALGPVVIGEGTRQAAGVSESEEHLLLQLEAEGSVLRCRLEGRQAWCDRRLLSRIHRDTLERLRREIEPVTAAEFWRFLACWQHAGEGYRLEGPRGVIEVARRLAGFEIAAAAWESEVLPARVTGYRQEWLDQVTLSGELVWGRLWGVGNTPVRSTPVCLLPREDLDSWLALAAPSVASDAADPREPLSSYAEILLDLLRSRGASFTQELQRESGLLPSHVEMGLAQLIGRGVVTCDSFSGLRRLITAPSRRRGVMRRAAFAPAGRWTSFRGTEATRGEGFARESRAQPASDAAVEFAARRLLARYGVIFRRLLDRERIPVSWRDLVRVYRLWELRGEARGGRFVQRFAGEQYALPEAVELMRRLRRTNRPAGRGLPLSAADPLNLAGILTPETRIPPQARHRVLVA
ncbi:MAG: DEAD/DEAH box helicase [Candidatus Eisenbacteria bacterium]|uniref:DEAD/DEAH box helicase n=1 Tax=Eiseniibacteriota bacterium TaxID=2212470 RepID=A0A538T976_UNCEI|nr:MAG: DEAD/DEAH box helicase [Candidatus Eisenbacteria bacterium]